MFRKLLIANRGEVAVRVLHACKAMGIQTVAVVTAPDLDLGWLDEADEVIRIGGRRGYLDQDAILEACRRTGATALHPGWGFLAENAAFSARCQALGITFVGPGSRVIRQMGDKVQARVTAKAQDMPLIPGSPGALEDLQAAAREAERIGFPVLLKASAGGGGRGMRAVRCAADLKDAWNSATAEAIGAFGNGEMYMEKLIEGGRHIEFQVLADRFGRAHHLFERECSIQRRHQKLLEEAPSPAVSETLRREMGERVAAMAAGIGYLGAGTVEMLRDADGSLYFMEMNTRLQVEHPVTEMVTGWDLVGWQLKIAANHALPADGPGMHGHAIEARINAEDPEQDFRPSPGRLKELKLPEGHGLRVETHLRPGDTISPAYDSMVCKLVAWGETRDEAIQRLDDALAATVIEGVDTTIGLHRRILAHKGFRAGDYDTTTLEGLL